MTPLHLGGGDTAAHSGWWCVSMTSLRARGPLRGCRWSCGCWSEEARGYRASLEASWVVGRLRRFVMPGQASERYILQSAQLGSTAHGRLTLLPSRPHATVPHSLVPSFPQSLSCFTADGCRKDRPINKHTCHITWPLIPVPNLSRHRPS